MRRHSTRLLAALASLSLACAGRALAWPTDPTQHAIIATGPGEQFVLQVASDGAGGALYAFTDSLGVTGDNIRVAHLRANGTLDPAWPAAGVDVCSASGDQGWPWIVSDGAGGAIVTWSDHRSGTNWDIYAHHVLASGVVDFGWPANGAIVCAQPGDQVATEPALVPDGSGGAIMAWQDLRSGDSDIYAHHITTTGMDAAWGAQGLAVCTATGIQTVTNVVSDEAGGAIIVWNDSRAGTSNTDVYAMRVLANGTFPPGWAANGVAVSAAASQQRTAVGVPDGQHGAILAWTDGRSGVDYDIYCHRLLANGTMSGSIAANGAALCVQPGNQVRPKLVSDGAGGAIVEWHDQRDGVNSAVYAHHATATGPDAAWPANGLAVRVQTGEWTPGLVTFRGLAPDGVGGAIVAWEDYRSGAGDVYALRVLANGTLDPAWPAGGRAVATGAQEQGGPLAFAVAGGRTMIAFGDHGGGQGWDSYAQAVTRAGELGVETFASGLAIPQLQRGSLAWGDYDNDGDLDLLMTGTDLSSPRCYLLRNDGGSFTQVAAGLPGIEWSSAEWGDFDADGDLDIAMAGWNGTPGIARIYRNDGIYGFTDIGAGLPGVTYASVAWGDADHDGDLDLLLAGLDNSNVKIARVYRNDGGTFTDAAYGLTGVDNGDAAWGDFDGDGDADLLLSGNTGSGRLTRLYMSYSVALYPYDFDLPDVEGMDGSLAWGDYDADGDLDILLSGWDGATRHLTVLRNDGGTFSDIDANLPGLSSCAVAWGDYDNDGDLDILASGYSDQDTGLSRIYRNDGGTFVDAHAALPGVFFSAVAWADWDNDGDLDPVLSGAPDFSSAFASLYRTDFATPNTPPTAPAYFSAVRSGNFVTFYWSPSTDAQTPAAALSYNLRIGYVQSPDFPVPSMSANDGFRRVVRLGNAGSVVSCGLQVLDGLPYVWSVQAIDGAFAGSPFSTSGPIVGVAGEPRAGVEGLHAPSPNPFRAGTNISWTLARGGPVEVTLLDPGGRRVRTLERAVHPAGPGSATWDGRDDRGRSLPPGLYFVRLESGDVRWSAKVVLAR